MDASSDPSLAIFHSPGQWDATDLSNPTDSGLMMTVACVVHLAPIDPPRLIICEPWPPTPPAEGPGPQELEPSPADEITGLPWTGSDTEQPGLVDGNLEIFPIVIDDTEEPWHPEPEPAPGDEGTGLPWTGSDTEQPGPVDGNLEIFPIVIDDTEEPWHPEPEPEPFYSGNAESESEKGISIFTTCWFPIGKPLEVRNPEVRNRAAALDEGVDSEPEPILETIPRNRLRSAAFADAAQDPPTLVENTPQTSSLQPAEQAPALWEVARQEPAASGSDGMDPIPSAVTPNARNDAAAFPAAVAIARVATMDQAQVVMGSEARPMPAAPGPNTSSAASDSAIEVAALINQQSLLEAPLGDGSPPPEWQLLPVLRAPQRVRR
jgi:hypothetical protein